MSLQRIDLTTALRPSLLPDETLLFVQDAIGLYEGKYKLPGFQNGHAYLTSHRACYVDNEEPRGRSVGVDLKDVDRYEFYAGFLKSSPKVILYPIYPKALKALNRPPQSPVVSSSRTQGLLSPQSERNSLSTRSSPRTASRSTNSATWICPICSLSNPVPSNFDPCQANSSTPLPPCLACGIKPPLLLMLKASISSQTQRSSGASSNTQSSSVGSSFGADTDEAIPKGTNANLGVSTLQCPRCTFSNHPSLPNCEMCGASLVSPHISLRSPGVAGFSRAESPGPTLESLQIGSGVAESIKFSFRNGGEKVFLERLKGAMIQRKWLLQGAPPVPKPIGNMDPRNNDAGGTGLSSNSSPDLSSEEDVKHIGIAGLERRGLQMRQNNELVLGNAFEDLEALMTSAKEIIKLADSFASRVDNTTNGESPQAAALLSQSASALGLVATKDMLQSGSNSESLYLSELSRNLAELLTDDAYGLLQKEGGMMSLVDIWAVFNRARGGVELVSPRDFEKAASLWEKLKLPVRLRRFKSGLLVVQSKDWTDDKTIAFFLSWLQERHEMPPPKEVKWDWRLFGRGITIQEVADRFKWSVAVATEELEMAEDKGILCRDEGVEGVRFWENFLVDRVHRDEQSL